MAATQPFLPPLWHPRAFQSRGDCCLRMEGVWQGLKVFEHEDIDLSCFTNDTMHNLKRTVLTHALCKGHRRGIQGSEFLFYVEARKHIYGLDAAAKSLRPYKSTAATGYNDTLEPKIAIGCDFILLIEKKVVLLQRKSQYIGIMDLKEIGQIIRERRAVLGVNQRTVSELSGVAVNTLVAIERGEGNPQITTLLDILETIGLQLDVKPKVMEYETR